MKYTKAQGSIPNYQLYGKMATPPMGSFFHVRRIETSPGGQCIIHQPHRHPNLYQIVWITGGYGTIRIDTREFDLESRAFFLLSPGCVHTCERAGRFRGVVIHFTADYLHPSSAENSTKVSFANKVLSRLSDEEVTVLEEIITAIEQEFTDRQRESYSIIYHRLNTIIAYLYRWYGTTPPCGSQLQKSVLARFEALVEQQYRSQRQVSTYAAQLHLTADHLSETVRRLTGKTAGEFIRARVLLEAQRLLTFSELTVSEVAYQLGFEDPTYFGRFFKRYCGLTPRAFRLQPA